MAAQGTEKAKQGAHEDTQGWGQVEAEARLEMRWPCEIAERGGNEDSALSILQMCSFVFWSVMRSQTLKMQQLGLNPKRRQQRHQHPRS